MFINLISTIKQSFTTHSTTILNTSQQIRSIGFLQKRPWKLSDSRKARIRHRLKRVEANMQVLNSLGIMTPALAEANQYPTYSQLSPIDRYSFVKKRKELAGGDIRLPVHYYPKFTKVQLPVPKHSS